MYSSEKHIKYFVILFVLVQHVCTDKCDGHCCKSACSQLWEQFVSTFLFMLLESNIIVGMFSLMSVRVQVWPASETPKTQFVINYVPFDIRVAEPHFGN